ncbi:helix-turn-helix transcriptional regulator [Streptomyces violascens]|uniref:Transcriptional regulator n=1 Tax=Streptomyces violascens TaxID=67381 RepID=A0ABQ3QV56_9ACTN|nr:helix-turn-helix transcriptional regulator [Streptomyces violascens]GGU43931.1 transcriptional regulator [Streptomyces violascens]GHI41140.1 transcriptional regulator [Streptomyces violascens]
MAETMMLGDRLRVARKTRRLSAAQLAQKVAVSPSYIQKLESGARKASPSLTLALSKALHFGVEVLTGQPYYGEPEAEDRVHAVVPELRRIMLCYDTPDELEIAPRSLPVLASEIDQIAALRRDARYAPMGPLLAPIITELTHVALGAQGDEQRKAYWHLARAYRAVNSLAHKLGHHDLSNTALERVRWAAERSGDPLMQVTASYLVTGAMLRQGAYSSARRKLLGLRQELERIQPERAYTRDALAVDGALLLKLAVLESRENNAEASSSYLREAEAVAGMAGNRDSLAYETSFGPTNIRIHEVHTLIDMGDTDQAIARLNEWGAATGGEWMPPATTMGERSSHHFIDVSSAKLATGDRSGAFADLQRARKVAPNHVRFHPSARETAAALLRLETHPSNELAGFASWTGVTTI